MRAKYIPLAGPLPCLSTLVGIDITQVIANTEPFLFTFVYCKQPNSSIVGDKLVFIFFDLNLTFDLYLQLSEGRKEASSKGFHSSILLADTKLDRKHVQLEEDRERRGMGGKTGRGEKSG